VADNRTNTFYIVAYDIPSDKRRTKVHKLLCGYGTWTQFSLFECSLSEKQYLELRYRLAQHLKEGEDRVRFYVMCQSCHGRSETLEGALPDEPSLFLV
jgi:CRISPR-associated protein Cas2